MTLAEALRSIVKDYKTLLMSAEGAAVDPSRDILSRAKASTREPRSFGNEAKDLEERVVRLARVTTAQLKALAFHRFNEDYDNHHPVKKASRTAILEDPSTDSAELAFLYGMRQTSVERIWREAGRDPATGERRTETPLTEPAVDTLKRSRSVDV